MRWAVCVGAVLIALLPGSGRATPAQLTIIQHGHFPLPPRGTFEAGPPFCASGTWQDSDANDRVVGTKAFFDRIHTCDDGSGTITVRSMTLDHFRVKAPTWTGSGQIVSGTGKYVHLRGVGTISGVAHDATAFTDTWQGRADFDDIAPSVRFGTVTVKALKKPKAAFSLQARIFAADNVAGNVVAYDLSVAAGDAIVATRKGRASSGSATVTIAVVKPPRTARRLRLSVTVFDEVGNRRTTAKTVTLPRG